MSTEPKNRALGFAFDATKVAPQSAPEAIPAGWYRVAIKDGESTSNDGGTGKRVALVFEILEGQHKGRQAFDGLQLVHSNPQTAQIGQGQFSAICHAIQVYQVISLDQLFGKPFLAKFDIEPGRWVNADNETIEVPAGGVGPQGAKFYEPKNRFKGCKPDGAAPVPTGTVGAPGGASPGWAKPAATPPPPPFAAPATPPAATPPPPFAAPATPTAPPVATGKPKGKPGPKPKAATPPPVVERKFWVQSDHPSFAEPVAESVVLANLQQGMPPSTGICLEGTEDWKTAADFGIGAAPTPPPAAATPPPVAPPVTPPATPAAGGAVPPPPWNR